MSHRRITTGFFLKSQKSLLVLPLDQCNLVILMYYEGEGEKEHGREKNRNME